MLRTFYEPGLRWIQLTWNVRTELGDGIAETNACGLSNAGKKIVKKMNNLGMIIDLAHVSPNSFKDALEISDASVIVSHANCKEICNNPRNVTDKQIEKIAENGGIIGLCASPRFLSESGNATIKDVLSHMNHLKDLVGIDHIGLGPDFIECLGKVTTYPKELKNATKIPNFIDLMFKEGYRKNDIRKISRENFPRVFKKVSS